MAASTQRAGGLLPLTGEDPRRIGPYRVVGRLGAGGMGVVLAGVDDRGVRAAVKVVHAHFAADPEFRARFAREISVLTRVEGHCTARVLGSDAGAERPWLATEYVPGPTLDERVREEGPLRGDELFGLAGGLAEALVAVHAAGVVHRDVKPSNVILSPGGPRLVDFGIARAVDASVMTRTGAVVGSPGWISPEEYGDAPAGPPADVYGWALLVVYAAAGAAPYGVARPEVLALRVMNMPVDTSAVPDALRDLVGRALSKDPLARPSSREVLETVADAWRRSHGDPAGGATAGQDVTTRIERTWAAPAEPAPWPASPPSRLRGGLLTATPPPRLRRGLLTAAAAALALAGVVAAVALRDGPDRRSSLATGAPVPSAGSPSDGAAARPPEPASTGPSPATTGPSPAQPGPPVTATELSAAIDLALEAAPAATFGFEGGFTQSSAGAKATGRLMNHDTQDDLDMQIASVEGERERYVVLKGYSVYRKTPGAKAADITALKPASKDWFALMVAGMAGPSTIRDVVAKATRVKREGRTYTGTLAPKDTAGNMRRLLVSWAGELGGPDDRSYLTFSLTLDSRDRPARFRVSWYVPVPGEAGIFRSDFTTVYRDWTASHRIVEP
ncbi:serine/threonine-protein kinase [Bailinhaonella thermotolerans]|uniref:Serine/threonine protein kinase n=1 Tax=Bailinhaonella thermotolerans TaxID=1070861 RepID=A0A3A4AVZ2_9ACTN|nr:serine/threonine-protein kinase [Bailinhaonella thermotolerans]RJL32507.1 serine/threonine protein kinase [Bailinhaonella thermotolerans]